jgi:site-specific DNA recombinase
MGTTAAHTIPVTAIGTVPVAFVGRTSTVQMQDPVASLSRQMRRAAERLPEGFYIARWYWDVESGGTDLDERSKSGTWEQFAAAGLPRDGGMAQLREEIASAKPGVAAVICENIERSGRDMFDALRLERELRKAGIPVFATDEPIDTQAPEAFTILVRRVKQGMAEYFRYNVKAQLWEGLKQYVTAGYNTGPCPYGYLEERTAHPNPMKRNMGATRARLVPDPERGPWVTRMFQWRYMSSLTATASPAGLSRRARRRPVTAGPGDTRACTPFSATRSTPAG